MLMIKVAALFNFAFAVFHLFFWQLLNWKEQLKRVSPVNSAVFQTLNLCLTFMFLLVACMYFFYTEEVLTTEVGRGLLLGMALFWFIRGLLQIYLFDLKKRVHQVLLIIFFMGIVIHLIAFIS
jgi:hypothetical protein